LSRLRWHIILLLALWAIAFSGVAAAEQLYVNESGWWYDGGAFNASGAPISAAVGAAAAGDLIFVWNGSYNENVVVYKRLTLEGEGADVVTVNAADSGDHVFKVSADYVNISGFTMTGTTEWGAAGISLRRTNHCNVSDNTANSNDWCGIYMEFSKNNTLTNNTASNNSNYGIYLVGSSNNTLTNNNASNNDCGIKMWGSNNNLAKNMMSENRYNFGVEGIQNIDTSNIVDGKPIYYWVNQQDQEIPDDAGYVGVVNCTNITVRDLTLTNNDQGVLFVCTNNSRIENVNVSNNNYGIVLLESSDNNLITGNTADSNRYGGIRVRYSSNNTLTNNIASSNKYHGIYLSSSSDNNTLLNNSASNNSGNGIYLLGSSNNNITNNTINSNANYGIGLKYIHFGTSSSNNSLVNNAVSNNSYGIYLASSSNNVLTGNNASNNDCGIMMWGSNNNTITCNLVQNNIDRGFYSLHGNTNNNISYNNVIKNGNYNTSTGGGGWQFYNSQPEAVEAKHNYWGAGMNNSTIDASIYDDEEGGWGEVEFYPFETEPVPCAPTPEGPHTFTTTDAVIALQIAAGSRPPDPRWDVSGDGSVTSLDALMILQAAAGGIKVG